MRWCEDQQVDYVFGLAKNNRLTRMLGKELQEAKLTFQATGQPARVFKDFIKEQQLYLFADRTSCHSMRANQLRLWFASAAYVLLAALRQYGLKGTSLQQARCDTIRLKLLKIGAVVRVTVRRVWFALAESCPYQVLFAQVFANLNQWRSQLGPAARRAPLAPA